MCAFVRVGPYWAFLSFKTLIDLSIRDPYLRGYWTKSTNVVAQGLSHGFGNESTRVKSLALTILDTKFTAEREMWELIDMKANRFKASEVESVFEAAEAFVFLGQ